MISLISAIVVLPWIAIAVVPVSIFFYVFKFVSSVSVRQFKRLENITRSPLLSHVSTSAQGLSTIVTFKQQRNNIQRYDACGSDWRKSTSTYCIIVMKSIKTSSLQHPSLHRHLDGGHFLDGDVHAVDRRAAGPSVRLYHPDDRTGANSHQRLHGRRPGGPGAHPLRSGRNSSYLSVLFFTITTTYFFVSF